MGITLLNSVQYANGNFPVKKGPRDIRMTRSFGELMEIYDISEDPDFPSQKRPLRRLCFDTLRHTDGRMKRVCSR